MKLFDTLVKRSPNKVFVSIILGMLSGLSYALLIPLVSTALEPKSPLFVEDVVGVSRVLGYEISNYSFAKIFSFLCLFILVTKTVSQIILTRIGLDATSELRKSIYKKISNAPVSSLESIGAARLIASITTDVPRISFGARAFPEFFINGVTLLGMMGFLYYLNDHVFWFVIKCIAFGVVTYQVPMLLGERYFKRARVAVDYLHESINGLILGSKELKLNRLKREHFYKDLLIRYEDMVIGEEKTGHTIVRGAINYGSLISFFAIGAVSFVFVNYHSISRAELVSVVMTLLYITGPIATMLNFFPQVAVARTSMKKVNELFARMPSENVAQFGERLPAWKSITFDNVIYKYSGGEDEFVVGPLSFDIKKGQITFIVGGNGSGKSTLSKLITQHYFPYSGMVSFGEIQIGIDNVESARQDVTAIYSDYYLFDRVLGIVDEHLKSKIEKYLSELGLDGKVKFKNGKFSTLSLSDGQRRRMALLIAYLEDKECYLFDEWAADQDPVFKEVFYREILRDLRAKNKVVVVISHDDRYFEVADQVLVMEQGKIVDQSNVGYSALNKSTAQSHASCL